MITRPEHPVLRQEGSSSEELRQGECFMRRPLVTTSYRPRIGQVTIDRLPDNVLLEIFHFYKDDFLNLPRPVSVTWRWKTMIQVCRRWRNIIFGSPRRLDLRLICTNTTPARTSLGIWPPFPIVAFCDNLPSAVDEKGLSNLIAASEHCDRISGVYIVNTNGPALEKIVAVLEKPFPTLTDFQLGSFGESVPVFPETFSGGSAPHLRSLFLSGIPFSTSHKFILSITQVEYLYLLNIPNSGYITPEAVVTFLAALSNLKNLYIGFRSPPPRPIQINRPPLTRVILPALRVLYFSGVSEYFEDIVARIDTPLLDWLHVVFFMDLIFHIPQFHYFIYRTKSPGSHSQAYMEVSSTAIKIMFGPPSGFELEVRCERLDWQLSSISQIFSEQLPLLSRVERFELCENPALAFTMRKTDPDMDPSLWLDLFHLFTSVQSLYLSETLVPPVAAALQELDEGGTSIESLPALQSLFLEGLQPVGPVQKAIQSFADSRRLSGHPVIIQNWERQPAV